ncbi:hypothetical protein SAMD00019534_013840 [Acytostelium subglobosum LB1]|uniref:hypothetical protein n=1 Tax=Acytostelium subglobosum LB1 TaxID=1410327 RepID=UPI000644D9EB|nr:hypothetical protein SAMD00019534_013840 [Acytostelium subglobosum LB1]GAM18209.1 hypothetical protein SAMD00019534_013840 [Acytostelium subglobosum LB1]|eukprot:XP_012758805.1 hypothetical protein SAMD00019534_013840 [Acytostelium subglobosum LB1]
MSRLTLLWDILGDVHHTLPAISLFNTVMSEPIKRQRQKYIDQLKNGIVKDQVFRSICNKEIPAYHPHVNALVSASLTKDQRESLATLHANNILFTFTHYLQYKCLYINAVHVSNSIHQDISMIIGDDLLDLEIIRLFLTSINNNNNNNINNNITLPLLHLILSIKDFSKHSLILENRRLIFDFIVLKAIRDAFKVDFDLYREISKINRLLDTIITTNDDDTLYFYQEIEAIFKDRRDTWFWFCPEHHKVYSCQQYFKATSQQTMTFANSTTTCCLSKPKDILSNRWDTHSSIIIMNKKRISSLI